MAFAATNAMYVPAHLMDHFQSWACKAMPLRHKRDELVGMASLDFNYTTDRLAMIVSGFNPRVVTPTHYVVNRRDRLRTRGVSEGE